MATIRVQQADFDIGAEFAALGARRGEIGGHAIGSHDIGGFGCFAGIVRDTAKGRKILSMTLEHYPAMTERAMSRIADEAEKRWPLLGCTLIHRVGTLWPGDNIVLVLTASAHRQAALDATGFLIDWLKTRAPFWKKERFADGDESWVLANADDDIAAARWASAGG